MTVTKTQIVLSMTSKQIPKCVFVHLFLCAFSIYAGETVWKLFLSLAELEKSVWSKAKWNKENIRSEWKKHKCHIANMFYILFSTVLRADWCAFIYIISICFSLSLQYTMMYNWFDCKIKSPRNKTSVRTLLGRPTQQISFTISSRSTWLSTGGARNHVTRGQELLFTEFWIAETFRGSLNNKLNSKWLYLIGDVLLYVLF